MKKMIFDYRLAIFMVIMLLVFSCKEEDTEEPADTNENTVQDADGNTYGTLKIGDQWWMAENLKTTKFRNGEAIPNVANGGEWISAVTAGYCNPDNDTAVADDYGRLYNWQAATDGRKVCPEGWHVPGDADWTDLITFLGGEDIAGGKLKQTGNEYWNSPNTGATNESGFTAIPAGVRNGLTGNFAGLGINGSWWSSTQQNADNAFVWGLSSSSGSIAHYGVDKNTGLSVRCVKD